MATDVEDVVTVGAGGGLRLLCSAHLIPLVSTATTDGDGGLVELVQCCPVCARGRLFLKPRQPEPPPPPPAIVTLQPCVHHTGPGRGGHNVPKSKRNADGEVVCHRCEAVIPYDGRGRPPVYCRRCKCES